jgi:dihydrolipoamide dehydrogenase
VDKNAKGVDFLMRKNKVTVIKGYGTIVNPTGVVKGFGDTSVEIDTKNIIVATDRSEVFARLFLR